MEKKSIVRKTIYRVLFSLLTILLTGALLVGASFVTRDKTYSWMHDSFNCLERGSVDTFFVGNSHSFCSIDTDLLSDDYGLESFMMSASGQTLAMDYYAIQEIIKYHDAKTVYLEMSYAIHDWNTINDEMSHMFFDGMRLNSIKVEGVKELIEEDSRIYYYLPLGQFHARASELQQADYVKKDSKHGRFFSDKVFPCWPIKTVPSDQKKDMPQCQIDNLDRIVKLCKDNGIELILWTAPYNAMYEADWSEETLFDSQKIYNGIEDYAKKNGLAYYNLFNDIEEIEFFYNIDFMDSQHLNCYGQEKLTHYMVRKGYISID